MKKYIIQKNINHQLPARALVFALLVVLMVALVSGALITLAHLQTTQFQLQQDRQAVLRNAKSGFEYLLAQGNVENKKLEAHFDLFGQNRDSVLLRRYPWGFYDVLFSKAHRRTIQGQFTQTKAAILGTTVGEQQQSALYLLDNNRSLSLVGKTRIEGVAYLPKAGVKRGYINGLSYYGDRLIYGEKKRSKRYLPCLRTTIKQNTCLHTTCLRTTIKQNNTRCSHRHIVDCGHLVSVFNRHMLCIACIGQRPQLCIAVDYKSMLASCAFICRFERG